METYRRTNVPTYRYTQLLLQGGVIYLRTLGLYQIVSLLYSNSQNIIRVNLLGTYSISLIDLIMLYLSIYLAHLQVYRSIPIRPRNIITTKVTIDSTIRCHLKQHLQPHQALRPRGTTLVQRTTRAANYSQSLQDDLRKLLKGQTLIIQDLKLRLKILEL